MIAELTADMDFISLLDKNDTRIRMSTINRYRPKPGALNKLELNVDYDNKNVWIEFEYVFTETRDGMLETLDKVFLHG